MKEALVNLINNIANLFKVKSIVTLALTAGLFLMLTGKFNPPQEILALYCTAYGSIITYFFTKTEEKAEKKEEAEPVIISEANYD